MWALRSIQKAYKEQYHSLRKSIKTWFCDISTAIADIFEANCNAPQNKNKNIMITHYDLDALDKRNWQFIIELKSELTVKLRKKIGDLKKKVFLKADVREERITQNMTTLVELRLAKINKTTSTNITSGSYDNKNVYKNNHISKPPKISTHQMNGSSGHHPKWCPHFRLLLVWADHDEI